MPHTWKPLAPGPPTHTWAGNRYRVFQNIIIIISVKFSVFVLYQMNTKNFIPIELYTRTVCLWFSLVFIWHFKEIIVQGNIFQAPCSKNRWNKEVNKQVNLWRLSKFRKSECSWHKKKTKKIVTWMNMNKQRNQMMLTNRRLCQ